MNQAGPRMGLRVKRKRNPPQCRGAQKVRPTQPSHVLVDGVGHCDVVGPGSR